MDSIEMRANVKSMYILNKINLTTVHLCACSIQSTFMYTQIYVYSTVCSSVLWKQRLCVDFIWFPEQGPIALGNADVMCLL
jgi:hypothetical protein